MKLHSLALACATMVYLAGCSSDSNNAASTGTTTTPATYNITGVAADGAPLVGVVVTVTDSTGKTTQAAATDANGKFSVSLQGTAPFVLTAPFNDADGSAATMSSIVDPAAAAAASTVTVQANLTPLTSLITQRVLGFVPSGAPTQTQITTAAVTQSSITSTEQSVAAILQPLYTALNVPASETADPIGAASYQANSSDALDNLYTLTRFNVHTGQISVGVDTANTVVSIPATGSLSAALPAAAVASVVSLSKGQTTTAIQNVIVVIGENQTFDAVFGAYQPPSGQTVQNLLSEGIINADGTPGPNFSLALQNQGATQTTYSISPTRTTAYANLPQPELIGVLNAQLQAQGGVPDPRVPATLPNGPFQNTKYAPYALSASNPLGNLTGDPVHRFFQMWQQTGGDNSKLDMYTWVATTVGQGGDTSGVTPTNPSQGGELMGFANMSTGDAPYFKSLAGQYAISDNYHQAVMGGTGMNFFTMATADSPVYNVNGVLATPPANQIENPNPMSGTPNFYQQDGYSGGSYVNCSDSAQPGVSPILSFLSTKNVKSNCASGAYYLVNNYGLGYDLSGNPQAVGANNYNLPPQTVPTIAEALASKGVSWKWYTGGRELADVSSDAVAFGVPAAYAQAAQYNTIGDALVASSKVMTTPALKAGLAGLTTLYGDISAGTLPAVSFVVPKNLDSGHPGYSVPAKYESFLQDLITKVQANPKLWAHTAILVTTDEGGGHFDTGYIQNVNFFGDGPRIPLLVVSPYARTGYIDHTYHDHSSVLKFIERNWKLAPLSSRSRDNMPNPVATKANPYQPINTTAVGDLMTMFKF